MDVFLKNASRNVRAGNVPSMVGEDVHVLIAICPADKSLAKLESINNVSVALHSQSTSSLMRLAKDFVSPMKPPLVRLFS
jgi:hypothetical protein